MQAESALTQKTDPQDEYGLTVKILSPKGVVSQGKAAMVSSVNSQGPFDLLPGHARFITLINDNSIAITAQEGPRVIECKTAVVRLINDTVTIYVDIT